MSHLLERGGGVLFKLYRNKRHLTQGQVAKKLKISVRQYQRIESGRQLSKRVHSSYFRRFVSSTP
ncbi:helix-turn-helix transcriptional regulator [Peribacillus muralis]|uniref:helix-turn-helix transcriptional regulator n=1 Tax=Peribacillus muralis TaxID=264697 RepID=UPI00349E6B19